MANTKYSSHTVISTEPHYCHFDRAQRVEKSQPPNVITHSRSLGCARDDGRGGDRHFDRTLPYCHFDRTLPYCHFDRTLLLSFRPSPTILSFRPSAASGEIPDSQIHSPFEISRFCFAPLEMTVGGVIPSFHWSELCERNGEISTVGSHKANQVAF